MFEISQFKNPDASYGIHPFWFWNGEMDNSEIEFQIAEMADKKVTGFFLCARQGLTIPYLSDHWFEKVNYTIETAENYGMNVWLYDEYPYPSGMAGGEVTLEHPDAKQYTLFHHKEKVKGASNVTIELPWGRVLFAKAVEIDPETSQLLWDEAIDVTNNIGNIQVEPVYQKTGLTTYSQKRFFTYSPKKVLAWQAPEGNWEIHCFLEEEIEDFKYYGTFVDPCHKEAMSTFIEFTHKKYEEKIGHHFGKTVKGIFADEIHLLGKFPWSPKIITFIKENYGYDIRDYLHLLTYQDHHLSAKIRYHYYQAIHLMTRDSFHKQVYDWCEKNGLEYVAEVPSARMTAQLYSHVPGGDSAHEKLGRSLEWILERYFYSLRANPKMISGLSYQLGRDRALIEAFHSVGWSMTLQDAKWMIDRLAAFGINFFNFHAFFYTLDAMVKHDAPPSQFLQNPYWKHYRSLGMYTARISYLMSQGTPIRRIAVLDPTTSLWAHMGNPYTSFAYTGTNSEEEFRLDVLKKHWADICKKLTLHFKDYDHLDPELLGNAQVKNNKLMVGRMTYEILILPPLTNIESVAWKVIQQFIENGGTVIANGLLPYQDINGNNSVLNSVKEMFDISEQTIQNFWNKNQYHDLTVMQSSKQKNVYFVPTSINQTPEERTRAILSLVNKLLPEKVHIERKGKNKSLLVQQREMSDGSQILFITNQEDNKEEVKLKYENGNRQIECKRLDLETGNIELMNGVTKDIKSEISLNLAPYQSIVIQIQETTDIIQDTQEEALVSELFIKKSEVWEMTPLQDNILRFHTFDLLLVENTTGTKVETKTFVDQCEDIAKEQLLPVQFAQTFGTPMKSKIAYPVEVSYETYFDVFNLPSRCFLLMDRHAITGELDIYMNGEKIGIDRFKTEFVYDHSNVTVNVLSFLKDGKNTLQIKGTINNDWEGVVDSLYLKGDFGVEFDQQQEPIIKKLPNTSDQLKGPYKGLPYYAGTIQFKRDIQLKTDSTCSTFSMELEELQQFDECAEIIINGQSLGVRAWSPYQWTGNMEILKKENVIELYITNTLAGLLEGKYFDKDTHSLKDVRTAFKK